MGKQISRDGQVSRSGQKNRADIAHTIRTMLPRDDLREAFAGDENKGKNPSLHDHQRSTHLKSRKTEKSKGKTPIR